MSENKSARSCLLKCDLVEMCLILIFFCLLSLTVFLLISWRKGGDATHPTPCCIDIATKVISRANVSIDPCTNFMDYACFNWREDDFRDFSNTDVRGTIIQPTLHGTLTESEAVEINDYYSSCKTIGQQGNDVLQGTVKALVDEFGFTKAMELRTLARVVTILSIHYRVDTVLRFHTTERGGYLYLTVNGVEPLWWNPYEDYDRFHRDLALSAANSYLETNVTLLHLQRKFNSSSTGIRYGRPWSIGVGILASIVPELDATFWVTSLEQAGYWNDSMEVSVTNYALVKTILIELVADSERVVTIVYILVRATVELSYKAFAARTSNTMRTFCYHDATSLRVPWHVLLTKRLTNPSKDRAVRGMYATLLQTVKEDLLLMAGVPPYRMDELKLQRRLVLPSDISAAALPLPHMTKNYWKNLLHVINMTRTAYRDPMSSIYLSSVETASQTPFVIGNNFIFVSPSAYGLLDFDKDTPDFVNAASFGIRLSSAIWRIMYYRDWPVEGVREKFSLIWNCSDVTGRRDSNIFLPYLSLPTVVRAYHTGRSWGAPVGAGQFKRLSRGQLFYILFFVHSSCKYTVQHRESAFYTRRMTDDLNSFIKGVLDFQCTFGCTSTSVDKRCFPTGNGTKDCPKPQLL